MEDTGPPGHERRRHIRYVVDLPTQIVVNGRVIRCQLVDVSRGGALIAAPVAVTVGDQVMLDIPGTGEVTATVVRTTPISFALAFAGTVILSTADGREVPDERGPTH